MFEKIFPHFKNCLEELIVVNKQNSFTFNNSIVVKILKISITSRKYFRKMTAIHPTNNNNIPFLDLNKCLPSELTIESVEDILHRIGLTLYSSKSYPKRKLFLKPIIIFLFMSVFTIKEVILISLNDENDIIFKIFGSIGYLLGFNKHWSMLLVLFGSLCLCFQLIYYYNYRNGIKPTFLRVFQMMSGLVSPKSLGLTDEQQIRKLLKTTKTFLKCLDFNNNRIIPIFALTLGITVYSFKTEFWETVCYGIPNSLILCSYGFYANNFINYQFLLFFSNCLYLKMKIRSFDEKLIEMERRKRFIRIRETLQSFDSLYSEIDEYNTTFCSKILFSFLGSFGNN